MDDGYLDIFWALLKMGKFKEIQNTVPEDFDWSVLHPTNKIPILVEALNSLDWSRDVKQLDNIEWLIRRGASHSQKCAQANACFKIFKKNKPDVKLQVAFGGLSCVSYIEAWMQEFKGKEDWQGDRKFLEEAMVRIARASRQRQTRPRASVREGTVEIWEKFLHATASHDLTIEAADGQVTAHSGMLQEASPVVQAMLASPMTEGKSQRIQLKDTSRSAIALFLEVLYTCSSRGDADYQTVLSALDLAHRWQVEVVVGIFADLLETMITEESFPAIAEHAALKHLDTLKQACRKFGFECDPIRGKINQGQFPKVVQDLFRVAEASPSQPVKRRKVF
eukprot:Skav208054  [mRNA]  locus=scaffold1124:149495:150502:- [translate_table: standard]